MTNGLSPVNLVVARSTAIICAAHGLYSLARYPKKPS